MKRLSALLILLPIGVVVVGFAVANRQAVMISIPPNIGDAPLYSLQLPLFVLLFATLFVGILLGSFATWITQGKHRKEARRQHMEATKATIEAQKQADRADSATQSRSSEQKALSALGLSSASRAG